MKEFGMGRTPIREALKRLASENLVVVVPYHGTFVSDINVTDVARISEVRTVLEGYAARLAAERATDDERAAIQAILRDLEASGDDLDKMHLVRLDQRIHRQVYHATHNSLLGGTLEQYYGLSLRIWFLVLDRVVRLQDAVREHRQLMRAILARDGARAEKALQQHVMNFQEEIRRVL